VNFSPVLVSVAATVAPGTAVFPDLTLPSTMVVGEATSGLGGVLTPFGVFGSGVWD
jgi:hypothetical protein